MNNRIPSAGTAADSDMQPIAGSSSPTIGNTHVGSSLCPSTQELFPIHKRSDLSVIDYHFSVLRTGDNEVRIPYVPLYDYLRCVEMLQAAEYQISVLQEAVSNQSQVNQ